MTEVQEDSRTSPFFWDLQRAFVSSELYLRSSSQKHPGWHITGELWSAFGGWGEGKEAFIFWGLLPLETRWHLKHTQTHPHGDEDYCFGFVCMFSSESVKLLLCIWFSSDNPTSCSEEIIGHSSFSDNLCWMRMISIVIKYKYYTESHCFHNRLLPSEIEMVIDVVGPLVDIWVGSDERDICNRWFGLWITHYYSKLPSNINLYPGFSNYLLIVKTQFTKWSRNTFALDSYSDPHISSFETRSCSIKFLQFQRALINISLTRTNSCLLHDPFVLSASGFIGRGNVRWLCEVI